MDYYELYWPDGTVYGVARMDTSSGKIERYNDGQWVYYPGGADEIVGGETGATPITQAQAEEHIASGDLVVCLPENVAHWS